MTSTPFNTNNNKPNDNENDKMIALQARTSNLQSIAAISQITLAIITVVLLIAGGISAYIFRSKISELIFRPAPKPEVAVKFVNPPPTAPIVDSGKLDEMIDAIKNPTPTIKVDDHLIDRIANEIIPQVASNLRPLVVDMLKEANMEFIETYKEMEIQKANFQQYQYISSVIFQSQLSSLDSERSSLNSQAMELERELRAKREEMSQYKNEIQTLGNSISREQSEINNLSNKKNSNCNGAKKFLRKTCFSGNNNLNPEIAMHNENIQGYEEQLSLLDGKISALEQSEAEILRDISSLRDQENVLQAKYENVLTVGNNIRKIRFDNFVQEKGGTL